VLDCCGKISHDLGLSERFEDIFSRLAERLQQNGITRVLTSCPGCSNILRKYGSKFEVLSVYEVLASESKDQSQESRIKNVPLITPAVVTIHDPCTARFDDAQQQSIRKLITHTGHTIHEMTEHGRTTRCCGQGGMVEGCVPGTVTRESKQIAVGATGQLVVTSCGACCDTLSAVTPAIHIADLLTGTADYPAKPASSAKRWLNRLKLRFSRLL
jgi:Fe-S oxidoreductase